MSAAELDRLRRMGWPDCVLDALQDDDGTDEHHEHDAYLYSGDRA